MDLIRGRLLRIFVDENARWHKQPLYVAIVEELRSAGFTGATVLKGIEGYGSDGAVHSSRVFDLSTDLPVLIEVIESDEKIAAFLPKLREMIHDGLLTLENVQLARITKQPGTASP